MAKRRILLVDYANSFFTHFHFRDSDKAWKFISNIRNLAEQFKVDRIIFAAEGGKSKYRQSILPNYKGDREARREKDTPEDKARYKRFKEEEFPEADQLAELLGIEVVKCRGVEADDTLAYLANHIDTEKYELLMLSTDYDMLQCLRPGVVIAGYNKAMVLPLSGGQKIPAKTWINSKTFVEQYSIEPWQYAHVLAVAGDVADSIPSPKGLGEGSALKMIQMHGSVQGVEENLSTLKIPRMPAKILAILQGMPCLCYARRNLLLTDLCHSREAEEAIFGTEGIKYLDSVLESLETQGAPYTERFKEHLFEYGKINVIDKLGTWMMPFCR